MDYLNDLTKQASAGIDDLTKQMSGVARDVRNGLEYSLPDQVKRFARAQEEKNARYLDIGTVYDGSSLAGQRFLITGGEQGLGLECLKELVAKGAYGISAGRASSADLDALAAANPGKVQIINGIDVTSDDAMAALVAAVDAPLDVVVNNAGYFYGPTESVGVGGKEGHMNFKHQMLQIDVCALGPLRITHALYKAGKLPAGKAKVVIITSQAGSCEWRTTQNANAGNNYGHHMSRAACNIMAVLLAEEFKPEKIPVQLLHPGFNRTTMTEKYKHIWDIEGAVEADVGAKRVLHEIIVSDMDRTGSYVNCEDGLRIPW